MIIKKWLLLVKVLLVLVPLTFAQTAVEKHGKLSIVGNKMVNEHGQAVQLRGMSLFWSQWDYKYWDARTINWLVQDWKVTVVRAAMGVEEGGYLDDRDFNQTSVEYVVDAAIDAGIYVVIDWHDHNAQNHKTQAITFFKAMAQKYKDYPNVIYEIYNEPVNVGWWTVKSYSQSVIDAIRAIDPDNIIVVGTPNWSQDVDIAAADPVSGSNIAYSLHFYAASHMDDIRSKARSALSRGKAIFVTEWGTTEYTGDGYVNTTSSNAWLDFMEENSISWCNWSISDKNESSAALKTYKLENWTTAELSQSGNFVRNYLRSKAGEDTYGDVSSSGGSSGSSSNSGSGSTPATGESFKVEAESFHDMNGIQTEYTNDGGSNNLNIAYIENGDWASYRINPSDSGKYRLTVRAASAHPGGTGGSIRLSSDGKNLGTLQVGVTGGWQTWVNKTIDVKLNRGSQIFKLDFVGSDDQGLMNINWLEWTLLESYEPVPVLAQPAPTKLAPATAKLVFKNGAVQIHIQRGGEVRVYGLDGTGLL
jgi:endoglucanase